MAKTSTIGQRVWRSTQAWNSARAAGAQRSISQLQIATSALQTARANQIAGQATLITKITQKRLLAEAQAKLKEIAASINPGSTSTASSSKVNKVA